MNSNSQSNMLVCKLGAMTAEQRQRHTQVGQQLREALKQLKELPNGYAFRYDSSPKLFTAAAEFVSLEHLCCPFYRFSLEREPKAGAIWLQVTGPKAAKSFIKAALAPDEADSGPPEYGEPNRRGG